MSTEVRQLACLDGGRHIWKFEKTEYLRSNVERGFLGLMKCVRYEAQWYSCIRCGAKDVQETSR